MIFEIDDCKHLYRNDKNYEYTESFYPELNSMAQDAIYVLRFLRQLLIDSHLENQSITLSTLEQLFDKHGYSDEVIKKMLKAMSQLYCDFDFIDFMDLEDKEKKIIHKEMIEQYKNSKN